MSKRFKPQDYFRYKRLGIRWRKPKGRQSKLRIKKGGSGLRPGVGYRTERNKKHLVRGLMPVVISGASRLKGLGVNSGIIISASAGAKNTLEIYRLAKEKNIAILNMKKVRRALKREEEIRKRQEKAKAEAKKTEEKKETAEKESKEEKKEEKKTQTGEGE